MEASKLSISFHKVNGNGSGTSNPDAKLKSQGQFAPSPSPQHIMDFCMEQPDVGHFDPGPHFVTD